MLSALFIIVAVFATMYVLGTRFPETARRWFGRIWTARIVLFGTFWLVFGLFAISSGVLPLVLFGIVIYAFAAGYLLFENPPKVIQSWMP